MTPGTLYVVATPIGNLEDLTARARRVLSSVPVVAAEDTRRARRLLSHLDVHPRLVSYHAHSPPSHLAQLLQRLERGEDVALVTDAGTPVVSDPGVDLVAAAREAGAEVVTIPGPSAVAAALSVSGFPADRFTFLGFLPRSGAERRRLLSVAAASSWSVVVFEAPDRVASSLDDMAEVAGPDRQAAVGRELTKVHEEVRVGTLAELAVYYHAHAPRGEVTIVLAGTTTPIPVRKPEPAEIEEWARALLADGLSRRDAARRLADDLGIPRREAYHIVTAL